MTKYVIEKRDKQMFFDFIKHREPKKFIFFEAINELESKNIQKGDWILVFPFNNEKINPGDVVLRQDGIICLYCEGQIIHGKVIKCRRFR
jgi:hypothetical protein